MSFNELFRVIPAFQTAICREHHIAVTAHSVASHVDLKHRHLAVRVRRRIVEEATALRDAGSLAIDTGGIRFPSEIIPAIEGLPVWSDGKKCIECGYIRRTRHHIQQHCRSEHGWANPRRRGGKAGARPAGGLGEAWVDGVHCQRFGQTGALQQLFEVVPPPPGAASGGNAQRRGRGESRARSARDAFEVVPPPPGAASGNAQGRGRGESRARSAREAIEAEFEASAQAIKGKDEAAAALISEQSRLSANMWVRRTGWPRHLRGFDREWLAATTRRPDTEEGAIGGGSGRHRAQGQGQDQDQDRNQDQDQGEAEEEANRSRSEAESADDEAQSEAALSIVLLAVERVIWRAQKASRVEVVGSAAVHYIERREVGGDTNEKPFNAGQKGATMVKYSAVWASVMAYIWRTWHLEPVGDRGKGGTEGSRDNGEVEVGEEAEGGAEEEEDSDGDPGANRHREEGEPEGIRDRRPAYHFTDEQAEAFDQVRVTAYTAIGGRDEGETGSETGGADIDDTSALEGHVLDFFIALLDHDVGDNEFQNALYSGLAVLGIQPGHGWRSALVYTPVLSAIVTVARMLVLYKAKRAREDEIQRRQRFAGESQARARERARSHFDRVREMVRRFMTIVAFDGQPSPMDSVLRLRAYGKAIRANTNADGVVDWHGDELLIGHVQFGMASLRAMIHGLLHTARAQLRRAVLLLDVDEDGEPAATARRTTGQSAGASAWPAIQWDKLVDNAAETRAGWSFAEDPRNREAFGGVDGKRWLANRVAGEARLRNQFFNTESPAIGGREGGGARWRMERVREYGEAMKAFRAQLLVLMHMSGGQPARGTELVTVQYKNGADGDIRGLFVEDGAVVFVTMYSKTMGMSAKAKVIHRYLPREVGELAVYYVWLAIPFWRLAVQGASRGKADWGSPYIWEPRADQPWPFPGSELGRRREDGDARAGSKRKRAVARNTARKRRAQSAAQSAAQSPREPYTVGSAGEGEEEGEGEGEGEGREEAGGRREEDAGQETWWQPDTWDTNRISRQIASVSSQHMGEKLGIMSWRHSVKAIYRRYIRNKPVIEMMNNADTAEGESEEGQDMAGRPVGEAFHAQSGHGARIGEGIYGRSMAESLFSTEARRIGFRRVSHEWHAFCMFNSVIREGEGGGREARPSRLADVTQQATAEEERRWKKMRQADVGAELRRMLGPEAAFRGVQEAALQAIMRQESPIVVVMGTGGGKSMLFMLPAACAAAAGGGVTIVVVPLVSLRGDIKDRCDALGIECVEWSGRRPHEWASIVLVTPEAAVSESFGHFINRQRAMGRLDRIIVDECHAVLDSGAGGGWRSRMLGLRGLVKAETQMVYLTATLRPADEAEFGRLVGLPGASAGRGAGAGAVKWFRGSTTRANVRYEVRRYNRGEEDEEDVVAALVEEKQAKYKEAGGGQIVVYCDTVKKAEQYAKRLGGLCYHRNVGGVEAKRAVVRQLREGTGQVFTATNALGLGVDAPRIRVVVHVGVVRRLRDYAQESGRAGRDGQASEAIIVRAVSYDRRGRPIEETAEQAEGRGVERAMWEFIETKGCVRAVLDREMDGRADRAGCEEGEEACYQCAARARAGRRGGEAGPGVQAEHAASTGEESREGRRREERYIGDKGAEERDEDKEEDIEAEEEEGEGGEEEDKEEEEEEEEEEQAKAGGVRGKDITRVGGGDQAQAKARGVADEGSKDSEESDMEMEAGIEAEIYRGRVQRRMHGQAERRRQAEESIEVEQFQAVLREWSVGCTWCRATGEAEEVYRGHTLDRCREENAGEIRRMVGQAERVIRWDAYSCCFDCGIPQAMCRRFEARGPAGGFRRVEGRTCQYRGVLMRTMVSIWGAGGVSGSRRLYKWMQAQGASVDEDDIDGRIRWMGRKARWGGIESNEMCRVVVQLWRWQQEEEESEEEE